MLLQVRQATSYVQEPLSPPGKYLAFATVLELLCQRLRSFSVCLGSFWRGAPVTVVLPPALPSSTEYCVVRPFFFSSFSAASPSSLEEIMRDESAFLHPAERTLPAQLRQGTEEGEGKGKGYLFLCGSMCASKKVR